MSATVISILDLGMIFDSDKNQKSCLNLSRSWTNDLFIGPSIIVFRISWTNDLFIGPSLGHT